MISYYKASSHELSEEPWLYGAIFEGIYMTKWCLRTSRCFNKTHYLVGSHFIDG